MHKSSIEEVRPGLQLISEQNDEFIFVSQHRSKPLVVSIPFSLSKANDPNTVRSFVK